MKLTREEKISLISGKGAWHTNDCNGKLPSIMMTDGPHGLRKQETDALNMNNNSNYATAFPTASAAACSFDVDLIAKEAKAIAAEAKAEKVSVVLGPGTNIKRSPLCGRNFEYYSEDPYLAGRLSTAFVNAMQEEGVGTSLKHYAGNNQEANRMTSNSQIDERALREIYTTAFEMTVKEAQPMTIMACYNMVNGEYGCLNRHLLTELLREKWGFEGLVVSDWGACNDLPKALEAGMDLEMPGNKGIHAKDVRRALNNGTLSEEALDRAAMKVAGMAVRQAEQLVDCKVDLDDSRKVALEMATESAVLLKNDGLLPIKPGTKVVVIGDLAAKTRYQGGGSSHIHVRPFRDAIFELNKVGIESSFARGYDADKYEPNSKLEAEALNLINEGDTVLFYGGLTEKAEGEGYDRETLDIPGNQIRLINKILEKTENVVFVGFGGAPMNLSFRDRVKSILLMYLGGEAVQEAAAQLITGMKNPCGKLAETFPLTLESTPAYKFYDKHSFDVEYRESIFVGYRYYTTYGHEVMYPFGYGLSYTTFEYSDLKAPAVFINGEMKVSVKVTNTGNVPGRESVQLYVGNPKCKYLRAAKELKGFAKTKLLAPGESEVLEMSLNERSFSVFDVETDDFIVPEGSYKVMIGASVEDIKLEADVEVAGVEYNPDMTKEYAEYFYQKGESFEISSAQFNKLYGKPFSSFNFTGPGQFTTANSLTQIKEYSILGKAMYQISKLIVYGMYKGKKKDDPEVMMMLSDATEGTIDSLVCQSEGMVPMRLAKAIIESANRHPLRAILTLFGRNY